MTSQVSKKSQPQSAYQSGSHHWTPPNYPFHSLHPQPSPGHTDIGYQHHYVHLHHHTRNHQVNEQVPPVKEVKNL